LLVVMIVALAIEPWGSTGPPPEPTPSPYQAPSPIVPVSALGSGGPAPILRSYRPEAFGPEPADATWTIRTPGDVVEVPSVALEDPGDIVSGPVVDLGPADDLDVLVIGGPTGAGLDAIRLWRFDDRGHPERQDLARLASPWPDAPAWAVGLRSPGAPAGKVAAWPPGLYRLDLLVGPAGRIRMVMLSVRAGTEPDGPVALAPGAAAPVADAGVRSALLRRLPAAANLWTVGTILTGWARPPSAGNCRVAEIWLARGPEQGCWAVPIGPTSALGVNLPAGQQVTAIELDQVDPLPGPVELTSQVGIGGQPGVAALETPADGLADGIYRMSVALVGGAVQHWYLEVGPDGRQAARVNAFVTSAQR
jgi:hypothetical protein